MVYVPVLYNISLLLIYFLHSFVRLNPLPLACAFLLLSPHGKLLVCSIYESVSVLLYTFVCFMFQASHISDSRVFIFLCLTYFINHSILWSIHVIANGRISFFFMTEQYAIVCVCVCVWASLMAQKERICHQCRGTEFNPWVGKIPWRREWLPTPVFLPAEFHGEKIPASYIPCGGKESDTAEQLVLSVYIYINIYSFSIYQFGALDSFHILAVINNAVMNIGVHSSF